MQSKFALTSNIYFTPLSSPLLLPFSPLSPFSHHLLSPTTPPSPPFPPLPPSHLISVSIFLMVIKREDLFTYSDAKWKEANSYYDKGMYEQAAESMDAVCIIPFVSSRLFRLFHIVSFRFICFIFNKN
jgi:hypothetical protein